MTSSDLYIHIVSFKRTPNGDEGYLPPTGNIIKLEHDGVVWSYGKPSQNKIPFRILSFDKSTHPIFDKTWVDTFKDKTGRPRMRTYRYEHGNWNIRTPGGVLLKATLKIFKYFGNTSSKAEYYGYEYYKAYDVNDEMNDVGLEYTADTPTPPPSPLVPDREDSPYRKYNALYSNDIFSFGNTDT